MSGYIQSITSLIAQNPNLAGVLVFLIAASESIAVIGAIIPGTATPIGLGDTTAGDCTRFGHSPAARKRLRKGRHSFRDTEAKASRLAVLCLSYDPLYR